MAEASVAAAVKAAAETAAAAGAASQRAVDAAAMKQASGLHFALPTPTTKGAASQDLGASTVADYSAAQPPLVVWAERLRACGP